MVDDILAKAVDIALNKGWGNVIHNLGYKPVFTVSYNNAGSVSFRGFSDSGVLVESIQFSLFDKDFAKYVWGNNPMYSQQGSTVYFDPLSKAWEIHLQQMVIDVDPINYLGKHLYE